MKLVIYEEETGNEIRLNPKITKEKLLGFLENNRKNITFDNIVNGIKQLNFKEDDDSVYRRIHISNVLKTVLFLEYDTDMNVSYYRMFSSCDLVMEAQDNGVISSRDSKNGLQFLRGILWAYNQIYN